MKTLDEKNVIRLSKYSSVVAKKARHSCSLFCVGGVWGIFGTTLIIRTVLCVCESQPFVICTAGFLLSIIWVKRDISL